MSQPLQLQMDVAAFLAAHAEFFYVPVIREFADVTAGDALTADYYDMHLRGEQPQNGKFGLCCIVSSPVSKITNENAPGPSQDYELIIEVIEHIGYNKAAGTGTGVRADDLAETIKRLLHLWVHDGVHGITVTSCEQNRELPDHLRGWLVGLKSVSHALDVYTPVATPQISVASSMMFIFCTTSSVQIWFTVDGSAPCPSNASAIQYTGLYNVSALPSGTLIRAMAFKTGLRASDCAFYNL